MARPLNIERKNEILNLSLKVFSRQVSWDVSLNEVARQLKTSTRMLVHHFDTREKLVVECKRRLKENSRSQAFPRPSPAKTWQSEVMKRWQLTLETLDADQRKLQIISSLQSRSKIEIKETELAIENLRELLPSRIKKFAEEILTFERGLNLQVATGLSHDRAFKNFQTFLKRL